SAEGLLTRGSDYLRPQIEQREQMPHVTREERHLVDTDHHDPVGARDQAGDGANILERRPAGTLVEIHQIGRERSLELAVAEREQRGLGLLARRPPARVASALVLITS